MFKTTPYVENLWFYVENYTILLSVKHRHYQRLLNFAISAKHPQTAVFLPFLSFQHIVENPVQNFTRSNTPFSKFKILHFVLGILYVLFSHFNSRVLKNILKGVYYLEVLIKLITFLINLAKGEYI